MDDTSLDSLRQQWRHTIHAKGGACPVCERFGKVYTRSLNKTMAKSLLWLYNQNMAAGLRAWIDVPNTAGKDVLRSNQLPSLRWWGLVERQMLGPDEDASKKHSGMWRVTMRGLDFVEGKVLVPKQVMTYNGECVGTGDSVVSFATCLDNPAFDYAGLMAASNEPLSDRLFAPVA